MAASVFGGRRRRWRQTRRRQIGSVRAPVGDRVPVFAGCHATEPGVVVLSAAVAAAAAASYVAVRAAATTALPASLPAAATADAASQRPRSSQQHRCRSDFSVSRRTDAATANFSSDCRRISDDKDTRRPGKIHSAPAVYLSFKTIFAVSTILATDCALSAL